MRIKSVNIVDEASNLQTHLSFSLKQKRRRFLLRQYRPLDTGLRKGPRWLKVDASRTNFGRNVCSEHLEADGTQLLDIPGEGT